ncbi:CapA family protein [Geothrix sp. 21YS21S-4]|uniref:CapA family protein n=1 Tax=Geothrix sp. 21YS21S-4 TaxID=3068889 RepID=UPI0027B8DD40|nr:CapA family protein [Geothrix sp. 21YS21S-4]
MGLTRLFQRIALALGTVGFALLGLACRARKENAPPPVPPVRIRIAAVGDILMHGDVKAAAERHPRGFSGLWEDVAPLFQEADIAFANLETPIAPATGRPGVPMQFNAPASLPAALRASGLAILSTANNYAFDQGPRGVRETLERLRAEGLVAVGSGEDRRRAETAQLLERRGVKVAFLAFTGVFNADLNHRDEEPWVRPLDLESALAAVREARRGADLVVVSLHWGNEYQRKPTERQRLWARRFVEAGCDLLLGHHPHVLQPAEVVEAGGRKALVAYSLGNFISNQDRTYRVQSPAAEGDSRDGAVLVATFERQGETLHLAEIRFEPLWTDNTWGADASREIRVVRIAEAERRVLSPDPARLRLLHLRRERIAERVGKTFVP